MRNIVVIGAGLSGTLLVINLLRKECPERVNIKWIDREDENNLGPAYSTNEDYLLNVPAERMGAFSKDPEHFLKWTLAKNIPAEKGKYLPRKLYRKYIKEMLEEANNEKKDNIDLERIKGEVEDIKITDSCAVVSVQSNSDYSADKVVLAIGNSPPKYPSVKNQAFKKNKRYIHNPWDAAVLNNLSEDDKILFVGTGQTMVDLAAGLYKKKHKGKLTAISRHGILPMQQKRNLEPYPAFYEELKSQRSIELVLKIIRKHVRKAEENGIDPRAVIDSLRPYTSSIWMQLPLEERKRFLRHAFRFWEIIRSRIPPESQKIINELESSRQLNIISGRITDIIPEPNSMNIFYKELKTSSEKSESVDLVINCSGPNLDYEQIEQKLIKNLLSEKIIQCHPLHIGINALPDGSILKDDGTPSDIFYTIGSTLKGIVWETVAAPEIREQAEKLSQILLSENYQGTSA